MKTLKLFYSPSAAIFRPSYTDFRYEIGDASVISVSDGKKGATKAVTAYVISQQAMTEEQSELFFHIWQSRSKRMNFEEGVKFAIQLSVNVSRLNNAANELRVLKAYEERRASERFDRSLRRALRGH